MSRVGTLMWVWLRVIATAGCRCECTGACGRGHADAGGRFPVEQAGGRQLIAAPRDAAVSADAAWRVAEADLAAWCSECLDAARRTHRRAPAPEATAVLLNLPGDACGAPSSPSLGRQ